LGVAYSENFVILACTVLMVFKGATDGRTDRRTDGRLGHG